MNVVSVVTALIIGTGIWFWLFALAFNLSYQALIGAAVAPIGIIFLSAMVLGFWQPTRWRMIASNLSITSVVLNLILFISAVAEGKSGIAFLVGISVVMTCSFSGALIGRALSRSRKPVEG